jgi:hypothetical protein
MTPEDSSPSTTDAEPAGAAGIEPKRPRGRGRKDISPNTGAKNLKSAADNAHDKGTADKNAERPSTLPRAEPDLSGGEGPAQTHESEHTEQELEPKDDGGLGDSRDIKDEQVTADNLPASIDADNAKLLAYYERAKQDLAKCESIVVCKALADKAAALAIYGRMQGDTELEKQARRIKVHAARRAGELLHGIPGETGGRPPRTKNSGGHSPEFIDDSWELVGKPMSARKNAARAAGMSEHQFKQAMRVATVPKEEFDRQVNGSKPPSVAALAKQGTRKHPQPTAPVADARSDKPDDDENHSIGAEIIARELAEWQAVVHPTQHNQIEANTSKRQAFVKAFGRLPRKDAGWAYRVAIRVKEAVGDVEKA